MHYALSTFRRKWGPFSVLLFLICCTISAQAQRPDKLTPEHFRWHVRALDLNEVEEKTAQRIVEDYQEEVDALKAAQDSIYGYYDSTLTGGQTSGRPPEDLKEEDTPLPMLVIQLSNNSYARFQQLSSQTDASYFDNLRSTFSNKQELIDSFERAWRREEQLAKFPNSYGANVDMVRLVDLVVLESSIRSELQEALRMWEKHVDEKLRKYEEADIGYNNRRIKMIIDVRDGKSKISELTKLISKRPHLKNSIIKHNEDTLRTLIGMLPAETAAELLQAWNAKKYPFIWTRDDETSIIKASMNNDQLDDSKRNALQSLLDDISLRRDTATRRLNALQIQIINAKNVKEYFQKWAAHMLDKNQPYPHREETDEFNKSGLDFLNAMKEIGDRARSIIKQ